MMDWGQIEHTILDPFKEAMRQTPQPPRWHGEGDVLTHTMLVVESLESMPEYQSLEPRQQMEVRLAAWLHDIGKCRTTELVAGEIYAPHHGPTGAKMVRQLLWQYGICGTPELVNIRETICLLIRYHDFPHYAVVNDDGLLRLHKIAANGELASDFSIRLLCILALADMLGRVCNDQDDVIERIALCEEMAKDEGCFDTPFPFPSFHTQHAYLFGQNVWKEQTLFDDTWGEIIMMSGLPGTGKDTWIKTNCPDLPMVSLDKLREKYNVLPTDNQGGIVQMAKEQAKVYLRAHQPFVWNATNLTPSRSTLIELFESYHARVCIVYLETTFEEQIRRNNNRDAAVPQPVIDNMVAKIVLPERHEATIVKWHCV